MPHLVLLALLAAAAALDCPAPPPFLVQLFAAVDSAPRNETIADGRIAPRRDLFHLAVAGQRLPQLCPRFLHITGELSILQLIDAGIADIHPGAFNVTPTLTLLRIVRNPLAAVRRHVFNGINVKEIDLSANAIVSIDAQAFDNSTHLEILSLNNNQLKALNPHWFANSPNVYKLSAVFNDITRIPAAAFRNMAQHRPLKLRLSSNRITAIDPGALDGHADIQLLRINGNKLTALPEGLFVGRRIGALLVNMNRLVCFPDVIYNATIGVLAFADNLEFECECLGKVRAFAERGRVEVLYPRVICADRAREVNVVFNYNETYEIPLLEAGGDAGLV